MSRVHQDLLLELLTATLRYTKLPTLKIMDFVTMADHSEQKAFDLYVDIRKAMLYRCKPDIDVTLEEILQQLYTIRLTQNK